MIVSLILELQEQDALKRALSGRDENGLEPILRFCIKHISNPRFAKVVSIVSDLILDIYKPGELASALLDSLYQKLSQKIKAELHFERNLMNVLGQMDLLLTAHES